MQKIRLHKLIGLALCLPILGWALTGVVFLTKPGYQQAYEALSPKLYSISTQLSVEKSANWQEVRMLKTVLGHHLLVKQANEWSQLDLVTLEALPLPSDSLVKRLFTDALSENPLRYGLVLSYSDGKAVTDKGVEVVLNWNTMTFRQSGKDSRLINTLYKIHYLQWFGNEIVDRIFAVIGIFLLLLLLFLGVRISINHR